MNGTSFKNLVSPKTGNNLKEIDGNLVTDDGRENFLIQNSIACLLDANNLDDVTRHEMDVFNKLDIQSVPYFRPGFYKNILKRITPYLKKGNGDGGKAFKAAEMGGGQGHWANCVKKEYSDSEVFVCDLSFNTLKNAPGDLQRICANVTCPIFEKNSINLATFWVSLHHLETDKISEAIREVFTFLKEGGIFIVFEPNSKFWLRRVVYRSRLQHDVYYDGREQAVDFRSLSTIAKDIGFVEVETFFTNPPYNPAFVKKLKRWYIYVLVVEFLSINLTGYS